MQKTFAKVITSFPQYFLIFSKSFSSQKTRATSLPSISSFGDGKLKTCASKLSEV
jgi:hypothetical protein